MMNAAERLGEVTSRPRETKQDCVTEPDVLRRHAWGSDSYALALEAFSPLA